MDEKSDHSGDDKGGQGRLRSIVNAVRQIYPEDSTITGRIMVTIFLVLAVLSIPAIILSVVLLTMHFLEMGQTPRQVTFKVLGIFGVIVLYALVRYGHR